MSQSRRRNFPTARAADHLPPYPRNHSRRNPFPRPPPAKGGPQSASRNSKATSACDVAVWPDALADGQRQPRRHWPASNAALCQYPPATRRRLAAARPRRGASVRQRHQPPPSPPLTTRRSLWC